MLQQTLSKQTVMIDFYQFLLQNGEMNTNDELDLHAIEWNKSLHGIILLLFYLQSLFFPHLILAQK